MKRKQTETPRKPDAAQLAGRDTDPKAPRVGQGAASALASLKRLERDRINAMPASDRPLG